MVARNCVVVTLLATTLAACGAGHSSPVVGGPDSLDGRGISGYDIWRAGGTSALDGLRLLVRPGILTGRSAARMMDGRRDPPRAYLDGARLSDIRALDNIHYSEIRSLRYLDATTATLRFGTGHVGGAVLVVTHNGRRGGR